MIDWLIRKGMFRNANHAIWFLCTIGFLLVVLGNYWFPREKIVFFIIPLVVHLPPFIASLSVVYLQKRESELYTKDCIWFNGLMILVYFALFAII